MEKRSDGCEEGCSVIVVTLRLRGYVVHDRLLYLLSHHVVPS